jgi:hypothetical protein
MTLTVRLDPPLEAALERYCSATGTTKSLVVQESLARYLVAEQAQAASPARSAKAVPVSANYQALVDAGFLGGGEGGGVSADKAAVRERARQRITRTAT